MFKFICHQQRKDTSVKQIQALINFINSTFTHISICWPEALLMQFTVNCADIFHDAKNKT